MSSGKGSSSASASRVMVVDNLESNLEQVHEEEDAEMDEDHQSDDELQDAVDDGDAGEDDDDEESELDLEGLSHVLTVTAKKLAGITLGRKYFTQRPKSSKDDVARKKQNSHCMACGAKGHWKGDSACPMTPAKSSSYSSNSSKGNSKRERPDVRKQPSQSQQKPQAFTVVHHEHGSMAISDGSNYGNMFQCNMVRPPLEFQAHEAHAFLSEAVCWKVDHRFWLPKALLRSRLA